MRKFLLLIPILLIITLLVALLHKPGTTVINGQFYRLARNIQQADMLNGQEYFFTGSSFAKLDIRTGKTTLLSNYFNTNGTIVVNSWSKNSVIFNTAGVDANDIFGQTATRAGLDPTSNHWWRYDFTNNQLELLDFDAASSCSSINELGNSLYCFAQYQGSTHEYELYSYNLSNNTQQSLKHFDIPVSSVLAVNNSLYFVTTQLSGAQTLNAYDTGTNTTSVIYSSKEVLDYEANKSEVLLNESPLVNSQSTNNRSINTTATTPIANQKLILLDGSNEKIASISLPNTTPRGQFSSSDASLDFTIPSGAFYDATGKTIKPYTINRVNTVLVWLINGKTYYIDNVDAFYSQSMGTSLKAADSFVETTNTYPNTFYVSQLENGQNIVYLNDNSKSFNGNAQEVHDFLYKSGYDPNQFNFNWQIINTGSNTTDYENVAILK